LPLERLTPYLDALASAAPVPGGGAAAAVTVAQGLALLAMVCNLTLGKQKFASVEDEARTILDRVSAMRSEAMALAAADMAAFRGVMDAYRLPAGSETQAVAKREALTNAMRSAAEPPCRLMELAAHALPLADRLEHIGNPNVVSDVIVGRLLLVAGIDTARENVEVNLRNLPPADAFVAAIRARMDAIKPSRDKASALSLKGS